MSINLQDFFAAFIEWSGKRKTLEGQERTKFERWVMHAHPEIAIMFKDEPAMLRQTCREIRSRLSSSKTKTIGMTVLKRYSEQLVQYYFSLPEDTRGTFADFLERVRQECSTEISLRYFLANRKP